MSFRPGTPLCDNLLRSVQLEEAKDDSQLSESDSDPVVVTDHWSGHLPVRLHTNRRREGERRQRTTPGLPP